MLRLLKYMRWHYWLLIVVIFAATYGQVQSDLSILEYVNEIASNVGVYGGEKLFGIGLIMIGLTLISIACTIVATFLSSRIAAGFTHDIRREVYRKVQSFSFQEIDEFSTASLITRATNDATQVQNVVIMTLRMAIQAPLTAILAIITVMNKSLELSSVLAVSASLLLGFVVIIFFIGVPKFRHVQILNDKLNLATRENLTGLRVVRAYQATEFQEGKFAETNKQVSKLNIFINRVMGLMQPIMRITMDYTSLAIMWVVAILLTNNGVHSAGDILEFQQLSMRIVISFMNLTIIFIMIPRGSVSGARINKVLTAELHVKNPDNPLEPERLGTIEFDNVSFAYPDAEGNAISNISFKVNKGQKVAIIGSTGSGKSTVVNLLPRFYDATEGKVLVDGCPVTDFDQAELRERIGYVPQKGILFSGTIRGNLEYGKPDATKEEMEEALSIAQAIDFVMEKEEQLESKIAQGGKNVSGGQKQRLAIARAIVKKPSIYIFDDTFSALDYKTDKKLREAINEKLTDATVILVAQRIGTIIDADLILVLDEGEIVGRGKHKELLETCKVYQEIAFSQLRKEELL